ncbi:hypothetical protein [Neopusillimonas aromaticivorans]|uniref:hypothetical protein n=1 Tax=Neopusillimonas aromaticivorans TaxID=2979868 RepID=UPI0033156937
MMLEIAPVLDQVGYHALDFSTSTHMAVTVRFHKEDPWERLRLLKSRLKNTPLTFLSTGMRFISWETAHPELMALSYQLLVNNGIERFMVMDPMNTTQAVIDNCRAIAAAGASEVVGALVYTVSPIHDDAFFATMAAQLAAQSFIHRVYLKDPGGLLTPERARTLLPAIKAVMGDKPFELHSHCTIGLAPFTYPEAPGLGWIPCTRPPGLRPTAPASRLWKMSSAICRPVVFPTTLTSMPWPKSASTLPVSPRRKACRWGCRRNTTNVIFPINCPVA